MGNVDFCLKQLRLLPIYGVVVKNIGTLIFDLDGTISDPSMGILRCVNYAFKAHGLPEVSMEQLAPEIGTLLDEAFRRYCPQADEALIPGLIAKYRERYAEVGYSENTIYPGAAESLAELSRRAVPMGICTSKRKDFAEKILEMFGILPFFQFVDGGDIGIRKQKQLAGLLEAKTIDSAAVMLGDRAGDILSAKANGLRSVGVLWGFGDLAELQDAGADLMLRDTNEIGRLGA